MSTYPQGFIPDLRRLRPWRSLHGSLWRSPDLVRLTYSELALLVQTCIGSQPCTILYVGPGLGHIALELARGGHDVTGVDVDQEAVALATRAAETDPLRDGRGSLSYEIAEFPGGLAGGASYDRVLFSRVLHHLADPKAAVDKAAELLGPGGRVVCVDFAHDRLGAAGARWMARWRMRLSRSGWWPEPVAGSLRQETHRTAREWRADHEGEGLNPFRAMLDPLRTGFRLQPPVWHPYLFWDLAAEMRVSADQESAVARRMREEEAELLRQRRLRGVLFSTTGARRTAASLP
jgi:2-polyprenyl-3-methyl-5-hydroxy-6-metoxy-1,4-benzoquinol methylase